MTEVLWPLDLCPSSQTWNIIGNAATFTSPLSGATRTYGRPGARLGCTMTFPMMRGQDRARLLAFINTLLDRSNRAWVPDFSTTRRGSFSTSELLTNNDFSNGTTGWLTEFSTLSVADRVLRVTNTKAGGASNFAAYQSSIGVTQYAPYVLRSMIGALSRSGMSNGTYFGTPYYATDRSGMVTQASVQLSATTGAVYPGVFDSTGLISVAGDYANLHWASLSRCALVDGGSNLLLQSRAFDTTWSATRASVTANSVIAPDGTTTADTIGEDGSAATTHFVSQDIAVSSSAADYAFACSFKAGTRTWAAIRVTEGAGSHVLSAFINLSTGAVGTVGASGSNWTNARASSVGEGSSWYRLNLIGRKASAATTLTVSIFIAEGDNDITFSGGSAASIYAWGASAAQSSAAVRGVATTTTAVSASAQTGSGIYVKGLPASTQGLLEAGDPVQIGGQLNFLTARLDSDAAGRGYLQCGRPWLAATNDAPVIVHQPMCKMILATDTLDLETGPGQFSPFQIELVEAIE
jgi:hypothetical protein